MSFGPYFKIQAYLLFPYVIPTDQLKERARLEGNDKLQMSCYQQALRTDPNSEVARTNLTMTYVRFGKRVIEYYQQPSRSVHGSFDLKVDLRPPTKSWVPWTYKAPGDYATTWNAVQSRGPYEAWVECEGVLAIATKALCMIISNLTFFLLLYPDDVLSETIYHSTPSQPCHLATPLVHFLILKQGGALI